MPRRRTPSTRTPTRPTSSRRIPSRSAAVAATAEAGPGGRRHRRHPQVPRLRPRAGRHRAHRRPDRAAAARQQRGPRLGRGQSRGALDAVHRRASCARTSGPTLTRPASTDPTQVEFVVQGGDTASDHRHPARGPAPDPRLPGVRVHRGRRGLTGQLQQGTFILRKNMTPDQLVTSLLAPPSVPYVDHRAARPGSGWNRSPPSSRRSRSRWIRRTSTTSSTNPPRT